MERQSLRSPTNYSVYRRRIGSITRRLAKEPDLLQIYGRIIDEQLQCGFMKKVEITDKPVYQVRYMPPHGVKKNSVTMPILFVYDCTSAV